jgi:hypothetical protein
MEFRDLLLVAANQPSAWTPFALGSSLLGYWDAEIPSTLTLSGGNVATWTDLIGGYAPTQGTANSRPAYSATSFNGRPGLTFDGTDDYLELASVPFPTGATPSEIWVLASNAALPADTMARSTLSYGGNSVNTRRQVLRFVVTGTNRGRADAGTGAAGVTATDGVVDYSGAHVIRGIFTATAVDVQVDAQAATSSPVVPATGTTRTRIGANTNGTVAGFWQGTINAVIVTQQLSAAQAAALSQYLKSRGGIA